MFWTFQIETLLKTRCQEKFSEIAAHAPLLVTQPEPLNQSYAGNFMDL